MSDWRPGTDRVALEARASMLVQVRAFFADRGVLEVDTPVLGATGVTDPAIECVRTRDGQVLQSSPEYFMKRLLAAGSGPIYQVARAFRAEEAGRLHNPEFLLLEWYRPGFDDVALMDEIDALLGPLLPGFPAWRLPFRDVLGQRLGVDPLLAPADELAAALTRHFTQAGREADVAALTGGERTALLDLAYAEAIDGWPGALFVHDFPPQQAALARLREDPQGETVAARFELVVDGIELANGYHELGDAAEQRRRFEADRARRRAAGRLAPDVDEHLLAALAAGLPDCAGVALGLDRVLLLRSGATDLDAVMPFSRSRL
ncbi:MAG: EF-P lysine aminoacylase GenX [Gammaproteobacteria bacterium]|nr:MAG: EF-P lysine aminoacylase GenX [Gammaproteobacteria bacterium]